MVNEAKARDGSPQGDGGDLIGTAQAKGWLASGWFTPDYRPLAERLARQLAAAGAPYHLLAVEKSGDWSREVFRKPAIVQKAMAAHPGDTIVLMDVDCLVRGPIVELATGTADVSCFLNVKKHNGHLLTVLSSRVMVIRPTDGARRLIQRWVDACREDTTFLTDEPGLMIALARAVDTHWSALDARFAGREATAAPEGAVIVHESAREQSTAFRRLNQQLKVLRRKLLGRTTRGLVHK